MKYICAYNFLSYYHFNNVKSYYLLGILRLFRDANFYDLTKE